MKNDPNDQNLQSSYFQLWMVGCFLYSSLLIFASFLILQSSYSILLFTTALLLLLSPLQLVSPPPKKTRYRTLRNHHLTRKVKEYVLPYSLYPFYDNSYSQSSPRKSFRPKPSACPYKPLLMGTTHKKKLGT